MAQGGGLGGAFDTADGGAGADRSARIDTPAPFDITRVNLYIELGGGGKTAAEPEPARKPLAVRKTSVKSGLGRDFEKIETINAERAIGEYATEEAALAAVKITNKAGAVALEEGTYIAYDSASEFTYQHEVEKLTLSKTTVHPPEPLPGVVALVSTEGIVVRPSSSYPGEGSAEQHFASVADPFQGYKDALAGGGSLESLDDDALLNAFENAMRDNALVILALAEQEVLRKQERFARGVAGVPTSEMATIRATADDLSDVDKRIDLAKEHYADVHRALVRGVSRMSPAGSGSPTEPWHPDTLTAHREAEAQLKQLQEERQAIIARYPLLSRLHRPRPLIPGRRGPTAADPFRALDDEKKIERLAEELPGMLESIKETRSNIADGSLDLWGVKSVVDSTIVGLGIQDPKKREMILAKQQQIALMTTIKSVVLAIFSIGLGIGAAVATGGLSLALTAGALGLSVYDAVTTTMQYDVDAAAANVAENKDEGFADEPNFAWVVVAWAGVGLDTGDLLKAAKAIEAAHSIADVARVADEVAKGDEVLKARLLAAAGDLPAEQAVKAVEDLPGLSARLGAPISVVPGSDEIRVVWDVDEFKKTRRIVITEVQAGADATVADLLRHQETIRLMIRYEGQVGKLLKLWDRLLAITGLAPTAPNPFPEGSLAWESWLELQKLPGIIDARVDRLGSELDHAARAKLEQDIDFLRQEFAHHKQIVDDIAVELGRGFVAKAGDSTRAAIRGPQKHQLRDIKGPDGSPKPADQITDADIEASDYMYVQTKPGTYAPRRKPLREVKPVRGTQRADGTWEYEEVERALSRTEKADIIARGFGDQGYAVYKALRAKKLQEGFKVVPLKGLQPTGKTLAEVVSAAKATTFESELEGILLKAYTKLGKENPAKLAEDMTQALMAHPITLVSGTEQLRAFGYRPNYVSKTGETLESEVELHHIFPLYLGGSHEFEKMVALDPDLHDEMHRLMDGLQFDGAPLIQAAKRLSNGGIAIMDKEGKVMLLSLEDALGQVTPKELAKYLPGGESGP